MAMQQACGGLTLVADEEIHKCGCSVEQEEESHLFLGVMIALPAGLMLWAGVLRVAVEIAHRL